MSDTYIIEKLIIEFDLNSKQEYHDLVGYIEANLYHILLEELEDQFKEAFKETKDNLIIEKLEIELDPMPYLELKSPQLVTQIKSNLKNQLDTIDLMGDNKLVGTSPGQQFIPENEPERLILEQQESKIIKESGKVNRPTPINVSKLQSLRYYLLTGQFILGVELTPTEMTEYFKEEQKKNQLIDWVLNLPSKAQKYNVLQRVSFQIPLPQIEAFFSHPKIKVLNQSFQTPLLVFDENISGKNGPPEQGRQKIEPTIKSNKKETFEPQKQDPSSKIESSKEAPQKDKSTMKPEERETAESQGQESDSKKKILKDGSQNLLNTREGFYIPNAGIVIIAPYLPAIFQKGELLTANNKSFKNKESIYYAIQLLEFLVNKKTIKTENTTPLYKLLCGLPMETPINIQISLDEEHKQMANRLLLQVSKKWDIKIGDQIDMLRGSFFIRDGKLTELDDKWLLTVETKLYDSHLFKKMPWSFKRIKFPWMSKWLQVDWY